MEIDCAFLMHGFGPFFLGLIWKINCFSSGHGMPLNILIEVSVEPQTHTIRYSFLFLLHPGEVTNRSDILQIHLVLTFIHTFTPHRRNMNYTFPFEFGVRDPSSSRR